MALLEQLRPNLLELPKDEAFIIFTKYYYSRAEEIQAVLVDIQTSKKKKSRKKKSKDTVKVTKDQLELLKKLGLV